MYPIISQHETSKAFGIGGKAKNLFRLTEMGIRVPRFIVLPQEFLMGLVPEEIWNSDIKNIIGFIGQINIPQNVLEDIISKLPGNKYFAVRSSAMDEDNPNFSFAGQYESFLFVTKANLATKIKSVWFSLFSERVIEYRKIIALKRGQALLSLFRKWLMQKLQELHLE